MTDTRNRRRARASGRFLLRIPPGLHAALRRAALEAGVSLNDYCVQKLSAPFGNLSAIEGAAQATQRAAALFGDRLVGIVAFGSWARSQAAARSDVDLLVVLEPSVSLTRNLYRTWDEQPISWEDRPVEPHFVHLPEEGRFIAGVWAEVAVDGIVLFERGLSVSLRLAKVRRDIAEGRIVRKFSHGQPYWAEVA